jgi:acyl-coenzyme A thioesterase PaaI-like protein
MSILPQVSIDSDYSLCFGCGQNNPIGLKLRFQWDGKTATAQFIPTELYQGWPELVHGGIIICLLDEAMSYAALFEGKACVTAKIQAKLRRPASINEPLLITSSVTRKTKKLFESQATISLKDGTLIAEGVATQFLVPPPSRDDKLNSNTRKK